MSRSVFIGLILATVITLGLALYLAGSEQPTAQTAETGELVPGLKERVNDIERLSVRTAEGAVTLYRDDSRWRIEEKDGYEADFNRVHDLLRDLASGQRAEARTSNPDWHARLGVAGLSDAEAETVILSFPDAELPGLIIGRPGPAGQARFVRQTGQDQVWLSDRDIALPASVVDWLERSVMDIPAAELASVTLRHTDGDLVQLRPAGEGDDWVLMNVPEGREAEPMWRLRPVANGLANLRLEDVRRHESAPEDASAALYVTRDGLNFVATLFEDEAGAWVHFSVSAEVSPSDQADTNQDELAMQADAAAVDARLSPWQFRLPPAKFEQMTRRLEDLLAVPVED